MQLSQWYHSLANIQIFESRSVHFLTPALTTSEILTFYDFYLQNVGQDHGIQF